MKDYIAYSIILVLFIILGILWDSNQKNVKKFESYENAIEALNDKITIKFDGVNNNFSKLSPEIDLNTLLNSETFKSLSEEQKSFYRELKGIKGLISATSVQLNKQDSILQSLVNNPGRITNDSISFKLGEELTFKENDSLKKLQWDAKVKLDTTIDFSLNYNYDLNILTTYERQKDKSIIVNYKIDDPELDMTEMHNFIIPTENKSNFQKWLDKNKTTIKIVGGTVLFTGGAYVGYQIAK